MKTPVISPAKKVISKIAVDVKLSHWRTQLTQVGNGQTSGMG